MLRTSERPYARLGKHFSSWFYYFFALSLGWLNPMNQTRFQLFFLCRGETLLPRCLTFHASPSRSRVDWFSRDIHTCPGSDTFQKALWHNQFSAINFAHLCDFVEREKKESLNDNKQNAVHEICGLMPLLNERGFWHHFYVFLKIKIAGILSAN